MTKLLSQVNSSPVLGDALIVLRMSFYLLRERLVLQGQKPVHSPYLQLSREWDAAQRALLITYCNGSY